MIEKNTCSLNFCYISTNSVSRTRLAAMSRRNIRPPFVTKSKTVIRPMVFTCPRPTTMPMDVTSPGLVTRLRLTSQSQDYSS